MIILTAAVQLQYITHNPMHRESKSERERNNNGAELKSCTRPEHALPMPAFCIVGDGDRAACRKGSGCPILPGPRNPPMKSWGLAWGAAPDPNGWKAAKTHFISIYSARKRKLRWALLCQGHCTTGISQINPWKELCHVLNQSYNDKTGLYPDQMQFRLIQLRLASMEFQEVISPGSTIKLKRPFQFVR